VPRCGHPLGVAVGRSVARIAIGVGRQGAASGRCRWAGLVRARPNNDDDVVVAVVSVAVEAWRPRVANRQGRDWAAPEVQVRVLVQEPLVIAEWRQAVGALPGAELPGLVGWVGRGRDGVWEWGGVVWARDEVVGMG
jgi:hypothetical protein